MQLVALIVVGFGGLLWQWASQTGATARISTLANSMLAPSPGPIIGRASVIDGDTIEIHGERIRFNGIDAPESAQTCSDEAGHAWRCGAVAAEVLADFLANSSPTRCEYVERDQYGRFVGDCFRADGAAVQATLVRAGWAMDWPRYSGGAYASDQTEAQSAHRGIWKGNVQPPWEWRAANHDVLASPAPSATPLMATGQSGACNIKGNISIETGERIYHVPGQRYYSRTRISEDKGERWFCSEADALAAGWRKSRR